MKNVGKFVEVLRLGRILGRVEFKLRNEGTYLGLLWHMINPLLFFILLLLVFSPRLGGEIQSYPIYLLFGIITFNFFQQVTYDSTRIIFYNGGLVKSISFPKESLIVAVIIKTLYSHFAEVIVAAFLMVFLGVPVEGIVLYPLILIPLCVFVFGVSLILSTATMYVADMDNIWLFISRLLWFATPIFYDIGGQTRLLIFNAVNPMFHFITAARELCIYGRMPEPWVVAGVVVYPLIFLTIGVLVFNSKKEKFAELV